MNDEKNINKLLRGVVVYFYVRSGKQNFTVRSFGPTIANLFELSYFNFTQKNFYHYNVYIIMIFLISILKRHDINVSKSFCFNK